MPQGVTALIMAAERKNIENPLTLRHNVSNKCLINMLGQPLIMYVLQALVASAHITRIIIAIEDRANLDVPAIRKIINDEAIEVVASKDTMPETVFAAADCRAPSIFPLLVTTADNAMLLPDHLDLICARAKKNGLALSVGMTPKSVLHHRHPEYSRLPGACYEFEDGGYTNCNLYYVRDRRALDAAAIFKAGGRFKASSWRFIQAFGLGNLLRYRLGWLGTIHVNRTLSRLAGGRAMIEPMPFGDIAIDVDNETSFTIVEKTQRERAGGK
jgi:GTP:adenosylcobinamide-phosphate guanylyltransferase